MNSKFEELREKHPTFCYEGYDYYVENGKLNIEYRFRIGDEICFAPKMTLKLGRHAPNWDSLNLKLLEGVIFNIGMIELLSYWKCTCSPEIKILPYILSEDQQWWWRKLYWCGLGEFFYKNSIETPPETFMNFTFSEGAKPYSELSFVRATDENTIIVPIGGGKDSVVTLEDLRKKCNIVPFIINPRGATIECAKTAGFVDENDILVLNRQIDDNLLELNKQGFLNGHTPFSAMLAFYTTLLSTLTGYRKVALSNESSANEPTIPGTNINHQYSKSLEFELDFREYVDEFMGGCNYYYSHLRELTELQIAEKFAKYPQYFSIFKSCNVGSKEDKWCGHCAKCLFAYIILSPFIPDETMQSIFGADMLNDLSLRQTFDELAGISKIKPFECVGTISEVNEALRRITSTHSDKLLIKHYINEKLAQMENDMLDEYFNMAP